ncbi:hypothetical protein P153DRAFT_435764 [Dothidotthia symphoricarpi CBS 119687]|uniref:Uncharacterized protein n=1 Tax=Dothidotthia symphoricarpi CBS 119687 TaxID=1392245 RepID=A0A6A5ZVE5_9PLEO|nr:uncharacterized protein P153DRAFT_435764 [Dothidotthia symphoricarpi CBS 119687]KAF2123692.1 hypothetical protein P153DRAFT_435764 [Dothidotthia symphoricarpi CBS 119687]
MPNYTITYSAPTVTYTPPPAAPSTSRTDSPLLLLRNEMHLLTFPISTATANATVTTTATETDTTPFPSLTSTPSSVLACLFTYIADLELECAIVIDEASQLRIQAELVEVRRQVEMIRKARQI